MKVFRIEEFYNPNNYPVHTLRGRGLMRMLLKDFYSNTGKTVFTYNDLRTWYYGSSAFKRYKKDWHSIERLLRKFASDDNFPYLERAELDRRHVLFELRLPEIKSVLTKRERML